jgi:hypothetical protein
MIILIETFIPSISNMTRLEGSLIDLMIFVVLSLIAFGIVILIIIIVMSLFECFAKPSIETKPHKRTSNKLSD